MDDWQLLRKEKDEVTEWKLFKVTNESYEVTMWRNDGRDDSKWRNENVWFESDGTEVIEKRRKEKDEMT